MRSTRLSSANASAVTTLASMNTRGGSGLARMRRSDLHAALVRDADAEAVDHDIADRVGAERREQVRADAHAFGAAQAGHR
jgi:hypothetical protein